MRTGLAAACAVCVLGGGIAWTPARAQGFGPSLGANSQVYVDVEYLHRWLKDAPLSVPLVSTGPIATTHHGLLGPPENGADSTILYGGPFSPAKGGSDSQPFASTPGTRVTVGTYLDPARTIALEGSGFWLSAQSAGYQLGGSALGYPIAGIPVHNTVTYSVGAMAIYPGEDSLPFSLPNDPNRARSDGIITGFVKIKNSISLWGADLRGAFTLHRDTRWELTGLAGFRYLNLSEGFGLFSRIIGLTGSYAGEDGSVFDSFKTGNQFYGATIGLRGRAYYGPWFAELSGQIAPGVSHGTISVQGGYTSVNYNAYPSGPEGVFAQPANEGQRSANHFAFVAESGLKVGYAFDDRVSLAVGYEALYYSKVVRPTDQIDRNLPKGQTFLQAASTISTDSPAKRFKLTDFYMHGLDLALHLAF